MKETGTWLSRGFTVGALLTIIALLMGQSKQQGRIETKVEVNEKAVTDTIEKVEEHEDNWNKFLISQTTLNKALSTFVEEQTKRNLEQEELNDEFKEHIIRDTN